MTVKIRGNIWTSICYSRLQHAPNIWSISDQNPRFQYKNHWSKNTAKNTRNGEKIDLTHLAIPVAPIYFFGLENIPDVALVLRVEENNNKTTAADNYCDSLLDTKYYSAKKMATVV